MDALFVNLLNCLTIPVQYRVIQLGDRGTRACPVIIKQQYGHKLNPPPLDHKSRLPNHATADGQ